MTTIKLKNTDLISSFTNMNEYVQKYENISFDINKMREAVDQLIDDMQKGKVKGLITAGVNPSFTLPNAESFTIAILIKTILQRHSLFSRPILNSTFNDIIYSP